MHPQKADREYSSCNRAAALRRWRRRRGSRRGLCSPVPLADWWVLRRWPRVADSKRFSPSIWAELRPTSRQCWARFELEDNRKWPGFRWRFRCWRFTPWARVVDRWLGSMLADLCGWDLSLPALIRDRSATGAEPNPP